MSDQLLFEDKLKRLDAALHEMFEHILSSYRLVGAFSFSEVKPVIRTGRFSVEDATQGSVEIVVQDINSRFADQTITVCGRDTKLQRLTNITINVCSGNFRVWRPDIEKFPNGYPPVI